MSGNQEVPGQVVPQTNATPAQRLEEPGGLDMERIELITRVAIGALSEGGNYLFDHLRRYQAEIDQLAASDPNANLDAATRDQLVRYLAVGAAVRAQRGALQTANRGIGFSAGAIRKTFSMMDRLTDNPLGRPLRWPAERLAQRLANEINESVVVGHKEVVDGSVLVREASLDMMDEFIAYISESPELADLVSEQIGQQSLGMASAVAETGRDITGHADLTIEDKLRGWLGMRKRSEMPRSPFVGKPDSIHTTITDDMDTRPTPGAEQE